VVADWIEAMCVIPDGRAAGEPFTLTDEQYRFLLFHYRIRPAAALDFYKPSAAFAYRHSILVRPQKWGKGPLSAAMICAEAEGPVLFDGWNSRGEPVGRPWDSPWIQVAAASEDQTANVWRALLPMIQSGPLADLIPDTGETRINLRSGGFVEPVTASGKSRLGQRLTFAVHDEPHSWLQSNGGWKLADTQRRNLAGMGGRAIATTNAWDPAENSDAQRTFEAHMPDVYIDYPKPLPGSFRNKRERRRILKHAYGDAYWVDLDRIEADVEELLAKKDPAQAERFYGNRIVALSDAYFDGAVWELLAKPSTVVPDGSVLALGFDGSQFDDWTAIRARWIRPDGTLFGFLPRFLDGKAMVWDPSRHGGEVPVGEVTAGVEELFDRYEVARMYCDPPYWQSEIDAWAAKWPDRVLRWETSRSKQMSAALERVRTDALKGAFTHDGDPDTFTHVRNARSIRRPGGLVLVGKAGPDRKIDLFVADTIAHEAAADVLATGMPRTRERTVYSF
jgi:hypothetical protein